MSRSTASRIALLSAGRDAAAAAEKKRTLNTVIVPPTAKPAQASTLRARANTHAAVEWTADDVTRLTFTVDTTFLADGSALVVDFQPLPELRGNVRRHIDANGFAPVCGSASAALDSAASSSSSLDVDDASFDEEVSAFDVENWPSSAADTAAKYSAAWSAAADDDNSVHAIGTLPLAQLLSCDALERIEHASGSVSLIGSLFMSRVNQAYVVTDRRTLQFAVHIDITGNAVLSYYAQEPTKPGANLFDAPLIELYHASFSMFPSPQAHIALVSRSRNKLSIVETKRLVHSQHAHASLRSTDSQEWHLVATDQSLSARPAAITFADANGASTTLHLSARFDDSPHVETARLALVSSSLAVDVNGLSPEDNGQTVLDGDRVCVHANIAAPPDITEFVEPWLVSAHICPLLHGPAGVNSDSCIDDPRAVAVVDGADQPGVYGRMSVTVCFDAVHDRFGVTGGTQQTFHAVVRLRTRGSARRAELVTVAQQAANSNSAVDARRLAYIAEACNVNSPFAHSALADALRIAPQLTRAQAGQRSFRVVDTDALVRGLDTETAAVSTVVVYAVILLVCSLFAFSVYRRARRPRHIDRHAYHMEAGNSGSRGSLLRM